VSLVVYVAGLALIAAVAWFAAGPLLSPADRDEPEEESRSHERLRRRKEEALAAIREAEFDHELGKISDDDYQRLRERLESEALAAMKQLQALEGPSHGDDR
jgi:hypothetical protein